jgi:hypothetical protein
VNQQLPSGKQHPLFKEKKKKRELLSSDLLFFLVSNSRSFFRGEEKTGILPASQPTNQPTTLQKKCKNVH